jgi:glycosyltransferase involved in cell wall biosynthesis
MLRLKTAQPPKSLKILILNSEFPPIGGGAGTATANLAKFIASQGMDVKVCTSRFGHLPSRETRERFEIVRVNSKRERADRTNPKEQISFIISSAWYCLRNFSNWKPDVIWAFFGFPSGLTALAMKFFFRIPFIVSLRGGDVPGFRPYDFKKFHQLGAPFIRLVWKQASAVIANSEGLKRLALKFFNAVPIQVIPNGIDLEYFKPNMHNGKIPQLLFTGRVVYQKGLDLLIQALSEIKEIDWELSIIGDGSFKNQLHQLVEQQGMTSRVCFHGWCKQEALLPILAQADVFINPSRHEGMPNAVLEAMASGLPIIATRIAGNEDLVVNGQNGYLVESENASELKKAIQALLTNKSMRITMGQESRNLVENKFSWTHSGEAYLALLQKTTE